MSKQRQEALSTLARWREFQESSAKIAYQGRAAETRQAIDARIAAQALIDRVESRQQAAWSSSRLDLAYAEVLAEIAATAGENMERRVEAHAQAERNRVEALTAHHEARMAAQAVQRRREELVRLDREASEKRMYDQMQDLRNASREVEHA